MTTLSDWESKTGVEFLKKVGIQKDYKVLDFGCNRGSYTIPASEIAGENGLIYALDNNEQYLNILKEKSKLTQFHNIQIINNKGILQFPFINNHLDFIMLYDILHFFNLKDRKILYSELYRILKPDSILSVYPKHVIENIPLMEFADISLKELINEIENNGFEFTIKICSDLSHDELLEYGCIINFGKKYPYKE